MIFIIISLLLFITSTITTRSTYANVGWLQINMIDIPDFTPLPVCDHSSTRYNDSVYVFGGYNDVIYDEGGEWYRNNDMLRITLDTNPTTKWTAANSTLKPPPRTAAAMTLNPVTNELIVFGGYNRDIGPADALSPYYLYLTDLWALSPETGEWRELQNFTTDFTYRPVGHIWPNLVTIKHNVLFYLIKLLNYYLELLLWFTRRR